MVKRQTTIAQLLHNYCIIDDGTTTTQLRHNTTTAQLHNYGTTTQLRHNTTTAQHNHGTTQLQHNHNHGKKNTGNDKRVRTFFHALLFQISKHRHTTKKNSTYRPQILVANLHCKNSRPRIVRLWHKWLSLLPGF